MTRSATRLLITIAFAGAAASAASAQQGPGSAAPLPGTGDSTKISQGNRDNNQSYNQLIGAADAKSSAKAEVKGKAHGSPVPATAADIKAGASLRDIKGVPIGTIASSDGQQVVVDTGATKIGVPLMAFGKDDRGLLLSITADKFNQLVAAAHAKSQASN